MMTCLQTIYVEKDFTTETLVVSCRVMLTKLSGNF